MFKPILTAALALAAVPALAQQAPPSNAFNGAYVGIQGGWQQDTETLRVTNGGLDSFATNRSDGFSYGGQAGYDFHLAPQVVLGGEVAITGRTGRSYLGNGIDLGQGRTVSVTGRLGYQLDPIDLVYARGGYANARYTIDDGFSYASQDRDGYTVGAGFERQLTRRVSARLEYAYSDFGSDYLPGVAADLGADQARLNYHRHAVTAGLNFHF